MSRTLKIFLVPSFAAGCLLMLRPYMAMLACMLCLGLLALYAAALFMGALIGVIRGELPGWLMPGFRLALFLILGAALLCGPAFAWVKYNEHSARAYVARVVTVLEEEKKRTSLYPVSLPVEKVGHSRAFNWLDGRFTSDGETYSFVYSNPLGMLDMELFRSDRKQWEHMD